MSQCTDAVNISRYELKPILRLAIGSILTLLLVPLILLTIPFFAIRQIVIQSAKYFRPDLCSILNSQSNLLANDLFTGKPLKANIVSTQIFAGYLDPEDFLNNLVLKNLINSRDKETGELVYEKLQQYPVRYLGYTFWKREEFNIDNHVFFHKNLGSETVSNEVLKRFEEELLNSTYKPNTSTWEVHLVNNYRNPKFSSELMTAAVLKGHHSLGDGYSVLGAVIEGMLQQPLDEHLLKPNFPKRNLWEKFVYFTTAPFGLFAEITTLFANCFRDSPWKIPDSEKSWNQFCDSSDHVSVSKIKDVKNVFGVSFTSVLISAISAGICDNFIANRKIKVLKGDDGSLYCSCILPLPNHSRKLTNQATAAMIEIPTTEFISCEDRLKHCHSLIESAKNTIFPLVFAYVIDLSGAFFSGLGAAIFKSSAVSTGLTNFPTIPIKLRRGECEAVSARFAVGSLEGDSGVVFMILSHDGHITLTVTAEAGVMSKKELENFIKCFVKEIDLLHKTAMQRTLRMDED